MARSIALVALLALLAAGAVVFVPGVRSQVRAIVRPEPPPQITPLALTLPRREQTNAARPSIRSAPGALPSDTRRPAAAPAAPMAPPTAAPSRTPEPSPTPGPVIVDGRTYDAYIPAASKEQQSYKFSCEFDAAWVILQTYGIDTSVDSLIETVGVDTSIEPYIKKTDAGTLIYGGDIARSFSGDIKESFLARSTGEAIRKAFERYRLRVTPVHDRPGVEWALRAGQLVWMKTTVDFKPWRPATWVLPDGSTRQTVLGNDHAVVAIGFSDRGVVIRDVLGPTSSNWRRPYEYEVAWDTFLAAWGAQEFDGLAVSRPQV